MERETEQEERDRHDKELADANRERQIRQGVISDSNAPVAEQEKKDGEDPKDGEKKEAEPAAKSSTRSSRAKSKS